MITRRTVGMTSVFLGRNFSRLTEMCSEAHLKILSMMEKKRSSFFSPFNVEGFPSNGEDYFFPPFNFEEFTSDGEGNSSRVTAEKLKEARQDFSNISTERLNPSDLSLKERIIRDGIQNMLHRFEEETEANKKSISKFNDSRKEICSSQLEELQMKAETRNFMSKLNGICEEICSLVEAKNKMEEGCVNDDQIGKSICSVAEYLAAEGDRVEEMYNWEYKFLALKLYRALGQKQWGVKEVLEGVLGELQHSHELIRDVVLYTVKGINLSKKASDMGERIFSFAEKALSHEDPQIRLQGLNTFKLLTSKGWFSDRIFESTLPYLKDPSSILRKESLTILYDTMQSPHKVVSFALVAILDPAPEVRKNAFDTLERHMQANQIYGKHDTLVVDGPLLELVDNALKDPDSEVRQAAFKFLKWL